MSTKWKVIVGVIVILTVISVLALTAGDVPQGLEEYNLLELGLGVLFVSSPLWLPLVSVLAVTP